MNNSEKPSFSKFFRLLQEAPISSFEKIGNWNDPKSMNKWDRPSVNILNSEKGLQKIKDSWNKTTVNFDMYALKGTKFSKFNEIGLINWAFVRDTLGLNIVFDEENVTVIYTSNIASEKIPFTGWIAAHRLAHALRKTPDGYSDSYQQIQMAVDSMLKETAETIYNVHFKNVHNGQFSDWEGKRKLDKLKLKLAFALGTMKSARMNKIRDPQEFVNEIIAQYIITGKVTLNKELPKQLVTGHMFKNKFGPKHAEMSEEDLLDFSYFLRNTEDTLNYYCQELLENAQGNIYLM